jgi:hypothetical protein
MALSTANNKLFRYTQRAPRGNTGPGENCAKNFDSLRSACSFAEAIIDIASEPATKIVWWGFRYQRGGDRKGHWEVDHGYPLNDERSMVIHLAWVGELPERSQTVS